MKSLLKSLSLVAVLAATCAVQNTHAAWSYSSATATGTCGTVDSTGTTTDLTATPLNTATISKIPGIVKMAFVMDSTLGQADVIFVTRPGMILYYHAGTTKVDTIGKITSRTDNSWEDGLTGVAVRPVFDNTIFLYYAHPVGTNCGTSCGNTTINGSWRISRFNMDPVTHVIDTLAAHEKVILDIPSYRARWHTSGGMQFDTSGNLYIAVGDNETAFTGPANTHDLRGGILRIHPDDNAPNGAYSIPAGNFGEYMSAQFATAGRTALAAQYLDTSMVRPEIYVKGTRNAYTFNVNAKGTLSYSQCGPDVSANSEVNNIVRHPIYGGWPFYAGSQASTGYMVGSTQYGKNGSNEPTTGTWATYQAGGASRSNPVNTWTWSGSTPGSTKGVDSLPSDTLPTYYYLKSCAMGSVVLSYDGRKAALNSKQLPPNMDNVWIAGDFYGSIKAAKVDSTGKLKGVSTPYTFMGSGFGTPTVGAGYTDMKQGPDGNLYILHHEAGSGTSSTGTNYTGGSIARVDYKGTCQDPGLYPGSSGSVTAISAPQVIRDNVYWFRVGMSSISVYVDGPHELQILDTKGRIMASMKGTGHKDYSIPSYLDRAGVYYVRAKTSEGIAVQGLPRL